MRTEAFGFIAILLASVTVACGGPPPTQQAAPASPSADTPASLGSRQREPDASAAATTFTPFSDPGYSGFEIIAVGLGGSECELDTVRETFAPSDSIRLNAEYTPSLRAGTVVMIHLYRAGTEVDGYPVEVEFDVATDCVYGDVMRRGLPPGSYRLDVVPDTAPAIGVDFVVAPE